MSGGKFVNGAVTVFFQYLYNELKGELFFIWESTKNSLMCTTSCVDDSILMGAGGAAISNATVTASLGIPLNKDKIIIKDSNGNVRKTKGGFDSSSKKSGVSSIGRKLQNQVGNKFSRRNSKIYSALNKFNVELKNNPKSFIGKAASKGGIAGALGSVMYCSYSCALK